MCCGTVRVGVRVGICVLEGMDRGLCCSRVGVGVCVVIGLGMGFVL